MSNSIDGNAVNDKLQRLYSNMDFSVFCGILGREVDYSDKWLIEKWKGWQAFIRGAGDLGWNNLEKLLES